MIDHIWPTQVLGENNVAAISSGGTPSRTHAEYFNGGIMWVKSGDLNDSCLFETSETISELGLKQSAAKLLPPNTVLIAMYGATVGKTALLKHEAATNQAVCTIQPNPSIYNPLFLQYLLILLRQHLLNERYGGAQPNISQTIIRNLELPCPKVNEQKNIAAVLWKVQRAIETEERLAAMARELKQSAMRQLFTCGLGSEQPKETEIGQVPESWHVSRLGDFLDIKHGFAFKGQYFSSAGQYILMTPGHFREEGGFRDQNEKTKFYSGEFPEEYLLSKDDLLVAMTEQTSGLLGSPALVPESNKYLHNQRLGLVVNLDGTHLDKGFLYHLFNTLPIRGKIAQCATGSKVKHTSPGRIRDLQFGMPSVLEQQQIAAMLSSIDRNIAIHERKHNCLRELFQTLLHKLMTGEIRVADLDIDVSEVTQ